MRSPRRVVTSFVVFSPPIGLKSYYYTAWFRAIFEVSFMLARSYGRPTIPVEIGEKVTILANSEQIEAVQRHSDVSLQSWYELSMPCSRTATHNWYINVIYPSGLMCLVFEMVRIKQLSFFF